MTVFVKGFAISTPSGQVDLTAEEMGDGYRIRLAYEWVDSDSNEVQQEELWFTLDEATLVFGAGNQLVQNARAAAEAQEKEAYAAQVSKWDSALNEDYSDA